MSLEKLEDYLNKTESVTQFDQVKKENAKLKSQLNATEEELLRYKQLAAHVDGRPISLEALLKETDKRTAEFCRQEIELKAEEKFKAEAPELVKEELKRNLDLPNNEMPKELSSLLEKKVIEKTNKILSTPPSWPDWFNQLQKQQVDLGIQAGLNETFWGNVKAATTIAKKAEWPKFLDTYVQEVITPLCQREIIKQITTPTLIQKTCDKCGTKNTWELLPEHVADLIKEPFIQAECQNPQCKDLFARHKIKINLGDAIISIADRPHPF